MRRALWSWMWPARRPLSGGRRHCRMCPASQLRRCVPVLPSDPSHWRALTSHLLDITSHHKQRHVSNFPPFFSPSSFPLPHSLARRPDMTDDDELVIGFGDDGSVDQYGRAEYASDGMETRARGAGSFYSDTEMVEPDIHLTADRAVEPGRMQPREPTLDTAADMAPLDDQGDGGAVAAAAPPRPPLGEAPPTPGLVHELAEDIMGDGYAELAYNRLDSEPQDVVYLGKIKITTQPGQPLTGEACGRAVRFMLAQRSRTKLRHGVSKRLTLVCSE